MADDGQELHRGDLRRHAEAQLAQRKPPTAGDDDARRLLYELQVHQIELEMQNAELRASQVELDAARARYFDLYDLAPIGYCTVSAQGLILQANLTAAGMLGMDRAALVGQPLSRLILREDQDIYHLQRKRLNESGEPLTCEVRMVRHDDIPIWVRLRIAAAQGADGVSELRVVLSDIIAYKQAEAALAKATALQQAVFSSTHFSIIATDTKGVIQLFNTGAENLLDYTAAEVINKITAVDISDCQEMSAHADALSAEFGTHIALGFDALSFKASRGLEDIYELAFIRKDGGRIPTIVSVTALRNTKNAIIGYLLIGIDNAARKAIDTERLQFAQALLEKNTELQNARNAAEKANLAKSDFLSNMSHELRTPLNAILGFGQLIASDSPPLTASQRQNLDQILKGGWYLLDLINEILDLAQIESGKVSLSLEPVSLNEVMLECQAMIEPLALKERLTVTFPRFEMPCFVNVDRIRLKQILINLLSNAIKYNKGDGTVAVECSSSPPDAVRISVRDSGVGVAPEQLPQLFESFNRLGKQTGTEAGTGIGLVVTKRLVEMMGGVIGVDSTVGLGSVFWIELPMAGTPQRVYPDSAATTSLRPQIPEGTPPRTLLYVEDNMVNLELVQQLIERRSDLRMLSAPDGNRGIELARTHQPNVILMDIKLAGLSGFDTMKALHADPATAHIPIIAISANAAHRDVERAIAEGFFDYVTKPIKIDKFMDTLNMALALADTKASRTRKLPPPVY